MGRTRHQRRPTHSAPRRGGQSRGGEFMSASTRSGIGFSNSRPRSKMLRSFGPPGTDPANSTVRKGCASTSRTVFTWPIRATTASRFSTGTASFSAPTERPGTGTGELSYPYDICVDNAGRQYVCEFGNSRIQVFDAQDDPIEIIGGPGAAPADSAIPGVSPWIRAGISTSPIRKTTAFRNSSVARATATR